MTTINETAADIAGKELAARVLRLYGQELKLGKGEASPLDRRLREIRLKVDELLARGEVDRAEAYMEEERQALAAEDYEIRKLNQAYFAFHGTYADAPASTSPIGDELRLLRQRSSSLGEFLRRASSLKSYEELKALISSGP
jgi:predicted  nucleic acid-binding Zn-ribbon protein